MRRPASERAAVAKSREARLLAVERRLVGQLRHLWRRDRDGYEALVAVLRRVVGQSTEAGERAAPDVSQSGDICIPEQV